MTQHPVTGQTSPEQAEQLLFKVAQNGFRTRQIRILVNGKDNVTVPVFCSTERIGFFMACKRLNQYYTGKIDDIKLERTEQ